MANPVPTKQKGPTLPLTHKIRLTLIEGMLGTKSGNPELLEDYIVNKRPDPQQDELDAALPEVEEEIRNGSTFFNRDTEDRPAIFDYQVKGFFKDAQGCVGRIDDYYKMQAYKKIIDGLIFVSPRMISLNMPEDAVVEWCERPLRITSALGERVALARSEEVPAGTTMDIEITVLDPKLWKNVQSWLDYGHLRGLGQWRNSGKGRFTWAFIE